jgi:hypothetical protein
VGDRKMSKTRRQIKREIQEIMYDHFGFAPRLNDVIVSEATGDYYLVFEIGGIVYKYENIYGLTIVKGRKSIAFQNGCFESYKYNRIGLENENLHCTKE